jgi:hypothetical protein
MAPLELNVILGAAKIAVYRATNVKELFDDLDAARPY